MVLGRSSSPPLPDQIIKTLGRSRDPRSRSAGDTSEGEHVDPRSVSDDVRVCLPLEFEFVPWPSAQPVAHCLGYRDLTLASNA